MKILVTGGAGFVGSHIVDALIDRGHQVSVLDDLSTGRPELVHRAARLLRHDIRSRQGAGIVLRTRPQAVIHAAAQASVSRSLAEPSLDASINVLGTVNLLRACHDAGVQSFVYISTGGAAYGDTDVVPTPENHPMRPASYYGVSKVSAERYVECFGSLTAIRAVTLRLANVYGPRQDPLGEAGVVAIFTARLLRRAQCVVNGDGDQTRDFVYVGDVADAAVRAIDHDAAAGAFNISTGTETTINALYRQLTDVIGVRRQARHAAARPGEQRRSALLPSRALSILGWNASTSLDAGLQRTVEYFRRSIRDRRRHERRR